MAKSRQQNAERRGERVYPFSNFVNQTVSVHEVLGTTKGYEKILPNMFGHERVCEEDNHRSHGERHGEHPKGNATGNVERIVRIYTVLFQNDLRQMGS
jgi:hypothetical protein